MPALLRAVLAALFADPAPRLVPKETPRATDKLALFGVRLAIFALAAATFLADVLQTHPLKIAFYHDEHNTLMYEEAARKAIVDFHQFPAWNPYFCGGIVELANPPNTALSPDFIFRLVFGTEAGRRLTSYFFAVFGMEGVYRLARRHDSSAIGSIVAAIAFSCSYYYVQLLRDGWVFMFAYNLIPWAAYAFEEGVREPKWRLLGGVFMAWMVFSGGTYVTLYASFVLALLLLFELVRAVRRSDGPDSAKWWQPLLSLGTMAVVTVGLTAVRVLPMLQVILAHPRVVDQKDADSPLTILAWVVLGHGDKNLSSAAGEFYVGTLVAILAVVALLLADRAAARFMALAFIIAAFACGEIFPQAPYVYLHKLPLFSQLRFPFRMTILVCLFVALGGARGLTRIEDALVAFVRKRRTPGAYQHPLAPLLAGAAGAVLAAWLGLRAARDVVTENQVGVGTIYTMDPAWRRPGSFKQSRGNRWDAHIWPVVDMGSLMCFEENDLPESPLLRGDLPAEEYPGPGSDATVERLEWTPHRIVLHVVARAESQVFVNQNWHPGWRSNVGAVENHDRLLTVRVPAGDHRVVLRFLDKRMLVGGVVSVVTLLGLFYYFGRRGVRRVRELRALWRSLPWRTPAD